MLSCYTTVCNINIPATCEKNVAYTCCYKIRSSNADFKLPFGWPKAILKRNLVPVHRLARIMAGRGVGFFFLIYFLYCIEMIWGILENNRNTDNIEGKKGQPT